ncbi:putative mitochondrial protein [Cucumis melo var. makuwa]|uniref:Mitochondrial protein n=1 Tax=Cucumis melo var. makuwa TaxID=1194695 RepID=A0A5A7SQ49_CUCMM|nr:putative mitochondrial protein [Cucumis melo var. makuwa]TYK21594.1 putative mitochondrial protein [Cucumis melo var. makuwa]
MEVARSKDDISDKVPVDKEKYQLLIRKLIYLSHTRLDISYVTPGKVLVFRKTGRRCNLVTWRSKKQEVVARRSDEAEYRAINSGTCEWIWLQKVLSDLHQDCEVPMKLFCDNKAAISIANNPVQHDRTKHVEIDRN